MDQQLGPANTLPADGNPFASNVLLSPDGRAVALYQDAHPNRPPWTTTEGMRLSHDQVTGWHPLAPMSLSDTIRVQDSR